PASSGHELPFVGVRPRVRVEVLLPETPDFFEARVVGLSDLGGASPLELVLQQQPQRRMSVDATADVGRDGVVGKPGLPILADDAAVLQQAKMTRHAGLGDSQNAGQLRDVQTLLAQQPEEPQPNVVAEQPIERRRLNHIYESTLMYVNLASGG